VCSAIQDVATKEGIDMPYTTYTLDNQVMILTKDGQKLGPAAVADLAEQMDQADGSE
jgi:hypothetical protein